ncbi:PhoH family protein [Candidatus Odyssella thessalonicensis]|uniref:PhoH family protein n=1 Tax=Candidatus Odyssella thessalonicensis TaxID=84647 RepID=UPI000225BB13|nr:PhoH family protein [Candidatus Odyssella thessalonicensis]
MSKENQHKLHLEFSDNTLLSALVGPHDRHLSRIEQRLGVSVALRGNNIVITGSEPEASYAKAAIRYLYSQLVKGFSVDTEEVESAVRMATATASLSAESSQSGNQDEMSIATKRRMVFPRSNHQAEYMQALKAHDLVFGLGPAGTGKTYLAVAVGVSMLLSGMVERIVLSRPAVEAGERLGFLPGDMREKVDPYLRPLYDALHDMLPGDQVQKRLANGEIEVAPLAFMRGRTLSNAFVILDEAQNTTSAQMKMFLTRLGPNSRMVITGDLTQIDLPGGITSGLWEAVRILKNVEGIKFIEFDEKDVVRHHLVSSIVKAYASDVMHNTSSHVKSHERSK